MLAASDIAVGTKVWLSGKVDATAVLMIGEIIKVNPASLDVTWESGNTDRMYREFAMRTLHLMM